ncbi:putative disease resistance protein RGA4 [Mercurialis annua]|uniref:putative disease resistance protein RGA4 n=1 Tax=Mercurialis annua TaxID=3986 RepID=UPI00215F0119|nr:putative disease resistance protein RGA4 [Mercurialis annua]
MGEQILVLVGEAAISRLFSLITEEVKGIWGFEEELGSLQESLTVISGALQDAEEKQVTQTAVRNWLKKLKGIAYDTEDVLDHLAYETLRQSVEIRHAQVQNFSAFFKPVAYARKSANFLIMAHKVKKMSKALEKMKAEALNFQFIQQVKCVGLMPQTNFETDSVLDVSVVGRDADLNRIMNLLTSNFCAQQLLNIIPIVGMGGLGKTTLAKSVCEQVTERKLFDLKIWVYVSYNFDDKRILGEMLQMCGGGMSGKTNRDAILQDLEISLAGKKFLLVLDDVWNDASKSWSVLVNRLLRVSGKEGNAIIVTTRSEEVASMVETSTEFRHRLSSLSDDYCWSIMKKRVCGDGNGGASIPSELEQIGKEIAIKCRGVPLAAKVLGGSMRLEMNKESWMSIKNSNILNASDDEVTNVESILKLSFDRLPSHLKSCFAYCSIFRKDYSFVKQEVTEFWMAEGLVEQCNGDTANNYFNALILNSFFQISEVDELDNVYKYKMHDLIHDLALSMTKSEILISDTRSIKDVISNTRHLNLICDRETVSTFPKIAAKRLRSLFTNDAVIYKSLQLKSLRMLKFHYADIQELPSSIGNLKHLRYLDVSFTPIKAFPESITKLYNLQTLRFDVCTSLTKLPSKMSNLINLRHISFCEDHHMPSKIGRFSHLQTLPFFIVGLDRGGSIQELENLNQLRGSLAIKNLENVGEKKEAEKANLKAKTKLTALRFNWVETGDNFVNNHEEVLEGLEPHPNIERIKIENYMGFNLPSWLLSMNINGSDLNQLVELRLNNCRYCNEIPRLGHLPHLKILVIDGMHLVTQVESIGKQSILFPALKIFSLENMSSLLAWKVETEDDTVAFPCLEELSITSCTLLKKIPMINRSSLVKLEIYGCNELSYLFDELHSFPCLKSLVIGDCSNLTSFPRGLQCCTCLEELVITKCYGITSLPEELGELPSLVSLRITTGLNYFPHTMLLSLTGLRSLTIGDFNKKWNDLPNLDSLQHLQFLERLELYGSVESEKVNDNLPHQLQHLTALTTLNITLFRGLKALPDWLGNLSSLQRLLIFYCPDLKFLPSGTAMQSLSRLKSLITISCPLLKQSCEKGSGSEWPKISHIPDIIIQ